MQCVTPSVVWKYLKISRIIFFFIIIFERHWYDTLIVKKSCFLFFIFIFFPNLFAQLRELVSKVEDARSSLTSARDRGALIDGLMEQKRTGKIPGIYGRLVRIENIIYGNNCIQILLLFGIHEMHFCGFAVLIISLWKITEVSNKKCSETEMNYYENIGNVSCFWRPLLP